MSIGTLPADCEASMAKGMPASRQSRPISAIGWTVPMTFEAWLTMTRRVLGQNFLRISPGSTKPWPVEGDAVDVHPFAGQVVERPEDGIVLERGRDGVVARPEHAEDDEVEGVGRIVAETEPVGVGAVEELGQHLARLLDDERRPPCTGRSRSVRD